MFVRIQVPVSDPHPSLLVSEQALGSDQGKKFLYVLNDQDEVSRRNVEIGTLNDGLRVIQSGLKPGERVVLSGLQRVQPGKKVNAKNVAMLAKDAARARPGGFARRTSQIPAGDGGIAPVSRETCFRRATPSEPKNRDRVSSRRQPPERAGPLGSSVEINVAFRSAKDAGFRGAKGDNAFLRSNATAG